MSALSRPLPSRPRTYRFALTPLADAMFQLLIFFMLTSSLTPYSLVTLRGGPEGAADTAEAAPATQQTADATDPAATPQGSEGATVWTLGNGTVDVNNQSFGIEQLPGLAEALGTQDDPGRIVVLVTGIARVQDIAAVIEALNSAAVTAVQITRVRQ